MKKDFKNVKILEKTVGPENGKTLKRVKNNSLIKNDGVEKTVRHDKAQMLKQVQDDMGWFRCDFGALAPDKNLSLFTSHFSQRSAFTSHLSQKPAFTLAEVLITLGIIGVVAALTVPSLVAKYKERQRITQLKKAYSVLNQAFVRAVADYGTPDNWGLTITDTKKNDDEGNPIYDYTGTINVGRILSKYMKSQPLDKETVVSNTTYSLDGRLVTNMSPWKADDNEIYYRMNDGTIFAAGWVSRLNCESDVCGDFWIILPGGKSKKIGVDVFNLTFGKNGIMPRGNSKGYPSFDKYCNKKETGDSPDNQGRGCSAWVILNDNMDYLHCDDLSWDGKHKCSD